MLNVERGCCCAYIPVQRPSHSCYHLIALIECFDRSLYGDGENALTDNPGHVRDAIPVQCIQRPTAEVAVRSELSPGTHALKDLKRVRPHDVRQNHEESVPISYATRKLYSNTAFLDDR